MVKHKKETCSEEKTGEEEDVEFEIEKICLEKWRPGNRNFP